ncbi:uncharacterized protein UV8b_05895 [Ustilaginoidea virens]|uniref:Response regulatory domain-containing protein n=1 Tax=Ustilaginoidea virens TaxID=1159556 RepID=A0A8E5MJI3_USTVR|nr:uncharacterized protein UV8b_05895 [Ustilaginoidea virens]QUC21652.1 hypothetical protein UV8b_05895 [Ustilaginoidea virens]
MASDVVSRLRACLTRRKHSGAPSLASSARGRGREVASVLATAPSQSSREASCAPCARTDLADGQLGDKRREAVSSGAAGDDGDDGDEASGAAERGRHMHLSLSRMKKKQKRREQVPHPGSSCHERRQNRATTAGADSAEVAGARAGARAGAEREEQARDGGAQATKATKATLADSSVTSRGLQPAGEPGASPKPSPPDHNLQLVLSSRGNPAPASNVVNRGKDPPSRDPAQRGMGPPSSPSQRPLPPSPSRSTSAPPLSSHPSPRKAANLTRSNPASTPDKGGYSSRLCKASVTTGLFKTSAAADAHADAVPAAAAAAATKTTPLHAADNLPADPASPSHHGREPDELSFASTPAVTYPSPAASADGAPRLSIDGKMVTRKIWVRRPHASATTITITEDDLVDDVRDMILRKYANSLGRTFDSPDLAIRIQSRDQDKERILGPEELMARTIDNVYPGGQTVDEALIIDIPRRAPKASPRVHLPPGTTTCYITEDGRPSEAGEGYFPPVATIPSPLPPQSAPVAPNGAAPHSMAVVGAGQISSIPSPGGSRTRLHRERSERPRLVRTLTSSPTAVAAHNPGAQKASSTLGSHGAQNIAPRLPHSRTHSSSSDRASGLPTVKPTLPKSPGADNTPTRAATPPPRPSSPRISGARARKSKKSSEYLSSPNVWNGSVPPINVLIVEDNPINLKLLEAFVKRLKVRWSTAMNGRDAVKKWRAGGFHLVLMDIQLPVMNGLDATREIRRLESVNSIGVFSSTPDNGADDDDDEVKEQDRLQNLTLFKSPVIIVALTASSLQSDRHEALAAGCNDFLTKPVNFVWLERKVMEWGCMQALIDFDGWRKWKEAYSQQNEERETTKKSQAVKARSRRTRSSLGVLAS